MEHVLLFLRLLTCLAGKVTREMPHPNEVSINRITTLLHIYLGLLSQNNSVSMGVDRYGQPGLGVLPLIHPQQSAVFSYMP